MPFICGLLKLWIYKQNFYYVEVNFLVDENDVVVII